MFHLTELFIVLVYVLFLLSAALSVLDYSRRVTATHINPSLRGNEVVSLMAA